MEPTWYVYHNLQQLGPFGEDQVRQMVSHSMISQDGYLFKVGWKDWRPLADCLEELGLAGQSVPVPPPQEVEKQRQTAPRATIAGRVDIHNDARYLAGKGVNISASGIFVETTEELFQVGEQLKLTVRIDGLGRPFHVQAQVIRFSDDPRYPVGYGLAFEAVPDDIKRDIQHLVDNQDSERNRHNIAQ